MKLLRIAHEWVRDMLPASLLHTPPPVDRNIAIYEKAVELAKDLRWHGPDFRLAVLQEAGRLLELTPWTRPADLPAAERQELER